MISDFVVVLGSEMPGPASTLYCLFSFFVCFRSRVVSVFYYDVVSLYMMLCFNISSDIDECKLYGCPSSMACINTIGSFTCDCGSGRQYDVAQKTCVGN